MEAPNQQPPREAKQKQEFSPISLFLYQNTKKIQDAYVSANNAQTEHTRHENRWQTIIRELDEIKERI